MVQLGLLPASINDYTKTLVIVNPCRSISYFTSSEFVRTDKSETDSLSRMFLRNYPNEGNSSTDFEFDFIASASVVAHEMNHFVMRDYLNVDFGLDCGAGDENRVFHEGVLGTLMPHRHWHTEYSIGYAPSPQSRLWLSSSAVGQVHVGTTGLMTESGFPCSSANVYTAGRVLAQALWKLAWSRDYNSSGTLLNIQGITSKNDLVETSYEAAMQADGGSLEDFAWEFTNYADTLIGLSNADVVDWCQVFKRHQLDDEFTASCTL